MQNPGKEEILYNANELFDYIESLTDLGAMVYNVNIKAYEPKGKEWVKELIYRSLKHQSKADVWSTNISQL